MNASTPEGKPGPLSRAAELHELRTFLVVARLGSFRAAAREVHLTQQAVSTHIQRLERDLGVTLIRRTTRQVTLTPIGQEFAEAGSRLLREIDELWENTRRYRSGESGTARLGITYSAGNDLAPDLLEAVSALHPRIHVELRELLTAELVEHLREGLIEVGMVLAPGSTDGLDGWPIVTGTFAALLSRSHPLTKKRFLTPNDLAGLTLVMPQPKMTPGLYEATVSFVADAAISLTTRSVTSHGIPKTVYEGSAFVLWPTVIPRRYVPGGLSVVPIRGPRPAVDMWLLFYPELVGPAATRLIDVARDRWPPAQVEM